MGDTLKEAREPGSEAMVEGASPAPAGPNAIEVRGLGCRFGRRWAMRNLSFTVPEGSVTALLGRNGSGKSTTIQILLGLLPASEGTARVLGIDGRRDPVAVFRETAYVSERRELLEEQTVEGLARFVAEVHGARFDTKGFEDRRARFRLEPRAKCSSLSKGQRARLLLALALAARPKLLVLDEPTSGLDVVVRDDFLEAVASFAAEPGHAVLLSTHEIDDVARIADRAVVLRDGLPAVEDELETVRASVGRYLVRLAGVVPTGDALRLPRGAIVVERDPRAITLLAHGASERIEAVLSESLPVESIDRRPATMKEAFTCLTEPAPGGAS